MAAGKEVARLIDARERERQVLELRRDGLTFDAIARRLGYSDPSGAYHAFQRALARITEEPAQEVRRLELERLDWMFECLRDAIAKGRGYAIEKGIMIMDRRARLLGLDAPTKHQVTVSDTLVAEIESLAHDLGVLDAEVVEEEND